MRNRIPSLVSRVPSLASIEIQIWAFEHAATITTCFHVIFSRARGRRASTRREAKRGWLAFFGPVAWKRRQGEGKERPSAASKGGASLTAPSLSLPPSLPASAASAALSADIFLHRRRCRELRRGESARPLPPSLAVSLPAITPSHHARLVRTAVHPLLVTLPHSPLAKHLH